MRSPVYDGQVKPAYERTMGPGKPPALHAFPDGSRVALCGARRAADPAVRPSGVRCPDCEREAGRKSGLVR